MFKIFDILNKFSYISFTNYTFNVTTYFRSFAKYKVCFWHSLLPFTFTKKIVAINGKKMNKDGKNIDRIKSKLSLQVKGLFDAKGNGFDWTALLFIGVIMLVSLIVFNL